MGLPRVCLGLLAGGGFFSDKYYRKCLVCWLRFFFTMGSITEVSLLGLGWMVGYACMRVRVMPPFFIVFDIFFMAVG